MSPKIFSIAIASIVLALVFPSVSFADEKPFPFCTLYADLMTEPLLVNDIGSEFPEGFLPMERSQQSVLVAEKIREGGLTNKDCAEKLKRILEQAEGIEAVFPDNCQQFLSQYRGVMSYKLPSASDDIAEQLTRHKIFELYMLKFRSAERLENFCDYGLSVLDKDSFTREDFDGAKRKYPLPETCEAPLEELANKLLGTSLEFSDNFFTGMLDANGTPYFMLLGRGFQALFYKDDLAKLSQLCVDQFQ